MTFQDVMSLGNTALTLAWMLIAYALFKLQAYTFQVQADTFREQQKISQLENKKFLLSIRPQFIISQNSYITHPVVYDGIEQVNFIIIVKLNSNTASSVFIKHNTPYLNNILPEVELEYIQPNHQIKIVDNQVNRQHILEEIEIELFFSDEVGTRYIQIISGNITHLMISPPMFV
ncbi:hypothetical protein LX99_03977 [Mucilaginibacter oryzae]|uniref:Uncharacterized protein n=1 Tax=Mucilaginibacter oryzae TaxID=468058 RepID=A0A316H3Z3_9SPHI|nr:hypothetical protein [Mucilaginibacter oryzae]PWK74176.1 hypothetical protein LX99_03977 [Mucilaginibacter oryzae]